MDKSKLSRVEIAKLLQERDEKQMEELIDLLKESNMSVEQTKHELKKGDIISDKIAAFAGSWTFIIAFLVVLIGWIVFNLYAPGKIDPFPFILLNLVLSTVAAIQAPLILMSQNREEERNKEQARSDFYINVKSELILENLHNSLQKIHKENQEIKQLLHDLQSDDKGQK